MSETGDSRHPHDEAKPYEIRLEGHLNDRWAGWFRDMSMTRTENGETLLAGPVDQAALFGVLRKVRNTGLPLLLVRRLDVDSDKGRTLSR